jgi:hypothetical protein
MIDIKQTTFRWAPAIVQQFVDLDGLVGALHEESPYFRVWVPAAMSFTEFGLVVHRRA